MKMVSTHLLLNSAGEMIQLLAFYAAS